MGIHTSHLTTPPLSPPHLHLPPPHHGLAARDLLVSPSMTEDGKIFIDQRGLHSMHRNILHLRNTYIISKSKKKAGLPAKAYPTSHSSSQIGVVREVLFKLHFTLLHCTRQLFHFLYTLHIKFTSAINCLQNNISICNARTAQNNAVADITLVSSFATYSAIRIHHSSEKCSNP